MENRLKPSQIENQVELMESRQSTQPSSIPEKMIPFVEARILSFFENTISNPETKPAVNTLLTSNDVLASSKHNKCLPTTACFIDYDPSVLAEPALTERELYATMRLTCFAPKRIILTETCRNLERKQFPLVEDTLYHLSPAEDAGYHFTCRYLGTTESKRRYPIFEVISREPGGIPDLVAESRRTLYLARMEGLAATV